ncbi:pyrophosphatase [Actinomycetes bacterium KLBMP 9759]
MDLGELTSRVDAVSRRYAAEFGFERNADWLLLKLHEEVGELTQAHLMRTGQARAKGTSQHDRDARFAAELADVVCHACSSPATTASTCWQRSNGKWLSHE